MKSPDRFLAPMSRALFLAYKCSQSGDVPVGAVVLDPSGKTIGEGWNEREIHGDPTAHAEIIALRQAGLKLGNWNLSGCTLVVTLEPCTMCAGAIVAARIDTVVFGAWDEKAGACGSVRDVIRDARLNHQVEVISGVMEAEASVQLRGFFAEKRMQSEKQQSTFWQKKTPRYEVWAGPPAQAPAVLEAPVVSAPRPVAGEPGSPAPASLPTRAAAKPEPPVGRRSDRHRGRVYVPPLQMD